MRNRVSMLAGKTNGIKRLHITFLFGNLAEMAVDAAGTCTYGDFDAKEGGWRGPYMEFDAIIQS